ncbi:MAG: hypothetical protein AAGA65_22775, partial [Actinomycetota bacterium]
MDTWRHPPIEPGWLQLRPGERVLWTGKPGSRAHYADSFELLVLVGSFGGAGLLGRAAVGRWRDLVGGAGGTGE